MDEERWLRRLIEACRRAAASVQRRPGGNGDEIVHLEALCSRLELKLEEVRAKNR